MKKHRKSYMTLFTVFLSASMILQGIIAFAQSDPKAKSLLDQLSQKTKAYSSIKADFNYTMEIKSEDIKETQAGTIATKGDKYYLKIASQEIRCNGKTIWTYLPDAEEVQITELEEDNDEQITPTSIFTMYEKGFRHEFKKEYSEGGATIALIHIYPLDLDNKAYHTVKLYINKQKMQIAKVEIMGKEGEVFTYNIKSFQSNANITDDHFVFNKQMHPGVEVVDLR